MFTQTAWEQSVQIGMASIGWREVTLEEYEIAQTIAINANGGRPYNGCTHAGLVVMFGPAHVRHINGLSWFVDASRTDQSIGV